MRRLNQDRRNTRKVLLIGLGWFLVATALGAVGAVRASGPLGPPLMILVLTGAVLVAAWRLPGFRAWLFAILVNRCRTSRRRIFRRDRFSVSLQNNLAANGDAAAAFEWREEITRALARLRPIYREAFLLRYVENLDYAEMALRSGTGQSTLRMRVKRANDRLRELLQEVRTA